MATELQKVQMHIAKLRERESKLTASEWNKTVLPKLQASVGKTFAYRDNSYGSDCPKWDEFRKLVAVIPQKYSWALLVYQRCCIDGRGCAKVVIETHYSHGLLKDTGWAECSAEEFSLELSRTIAQFVAPDIEQIAQRERS